MDPTWQSYQHFSVAAARPLRVVSKCAPIILPAFRFIIAQTRQNVICQNPAPVHLPIVRLALTILNNVGKVHVHVFHTFLSYQLWSQNKLNECLHIFNRNEFAQKHTCKYYLIFWRMQFDFLFYDRIRICDVIHPFRFIWSGDDVYTM